MKHPVPYSFAAATAAVLLLAWLLPVGAQNNAAISDELLPLVQSLAAQQKTIDENQANIEKSLAVVQENVRQAKIYVSRAGSKPK